MTKDQYDKLDHEVKEFEALVKEILSSEDFDDFSFEFFRFITDFYFDHEVTTGV